MTPAQLFTKHRWTDQALDTSIYIKKPWLCLHCENTVYFLEEFCLLHGFGNRLLVLCPLCENTTIVQFRGLLLTIRLESEEPGPALVPLLDHMEEQDQEPDFFEEEVMSSEEVELAPDREATFSPGFKAGLCGAIVWMMLYMVVPGSAESAWMFLLFTAVGCGVYAFMKTFVYEPLARERSE